MDRLQLPKSKIKTPVASAECDQITKMDQIICFYVNTMQVILWYSNMAKALTT